MRILCTSFAHLWHPGFLLFASFHQQSLGATLETEEGGLGTHGIKMGRRYGEPLSSLVAVWQSSLSENLVALTHSNFNVSLGVSVKLLTSRPKQAQRQKKYNWNKYLFLLRLRGVGVGREDTIKDWPK